MLKMTPMPSPNNTNFARLYVLKGRSPSHAFDADPAESGDPDDTTTLSPDDEGNPQTLAAWCRANMSDEQISELVAILTTTDSNVPRDQKTKAKLAQDRAMRYAEAEADFQKRFPDSRKIRNLGR